MSDTVPQEKGVIIPSELFVKASQGVEASVVEDLKVPDPSPEAATAALAKEEDSE